MRPFSQALASLVFAATAALAATGPSAAADTPRVVASIAPVGSLTAAVMRGIATPTVLLPAGASPHAYALRPSEARALASADLVLWVGEALEAFLEEPLHSLARADNVVELADTEGLILYPPRTGGVWEADHEDEHEKGHARHSHGHDGIDPHLWLDPRNAAVLLDRITDALAKRDPGRADAYRANAVAAKADIAALDARLADELRPLGGRPYVVFHDAYQYLERRYDLTPVGAVSIGPERSPGARRLAHLRDEIAERGAVCAFREPQFAPKVLDSLAGDTGIRIDVLDPLGAAPGPDGYAALMRGLRDALVRCLSATG